MNFQANRTSCRNIAADRIELGLDKPRRQAQVCTMQRDLGEYSAVQYRMIQGRTNEAGAVQVSGIKIRLGQRRRGEIRTLQGRANQISVCQPCGAKISFSQIARHTTLGLMQPIRRRVIALRVSGNGGQYDDLRSNHCLDDHRAQLAGKLS
jgi:hypothetical protein